MRRDRAVMVHSGLFPRRLLGTDHSVTLPGVGVNGPLETVNDEVAGRG